MTANTTEQERARYSGSIQELKQYASEDVDAMVHICNKHIGNVPKGFFLAMQECAALVGRAPAVPVPQGWKLVPVEPTPEMGERGADEVVAPIATAWNKAAAAYRAMLAAAPQPPEADHIPDAGKMVAAPVQLPEYGIDTANHAGVRVRGYTEQQVRQLLAAHGIQEQST